MEEKMVRGTLSEPEVSHSGLWRILIIIATLGVIGLAVWYFFVGGNKTQQSVTPTSNGTSAENQTNSTVKTATTVEQKLQVLQRLSMPTATSTTAVVPTSTSSQAQIIDERTRILQGLAPSTTLGSNLTDAEKLRILNSLHN